MNLCFIEWDNQCYYWHLANEVMIVCIYIYIYMYVYCDDCHVILVRLHTVKSQFHPLSHNFLINVARGGINSPLEKMMLPSFAGTSDIFFRGFVGFLLLMSTTVNSGF